MPLSTIDNTGLSQSQIITAVNMPTGSVIQVVQSVYSTYAMTSSSTPSATGLTATITPQFSTSKILITCNYNSAVNSSGSNNGVSVWSIYRGTSTSLISMYNRTYNYNNSSGLYNNVPATTIYLDSPSTTSAVTYNLYYALTAGSGATLNGDGGTSSITLMEIR